jgi:hypothetical protein
MELTHPAVQTYWIITAGFFPVAGTTAPEQVTTFGPGWSLLLQTADEAEWLAECARLGIGEPQPA